MILRAINLSREMEIELVKCECCGLREDCTKDYISSVKADFDGKWLCGLCSEAVRDEQIRRRGRRTGGHAVVEEEAIEAHLSFCANAAKSNPAVRVADGMRQMLRRRRSGGDLSKSSSATPLPSRFGRMASASKVGDEPRSFFLLELDEGCSREGTD